MLGKLTIHVWVLTGSKTNSKQVFVFWIPKMNKTNKKHCTVYSFISQHALCI